MSTLQFPGGRRFDLACLGRLAVYLFAQQVGCALEDATSFAKYLGGSSANIAFGVARLGLRSAMVSRVEDQQDKWSGAMLVSDAQIGLKGIGRP
jgi:5-dehydro-2-deoxygluconokinase